MAEEIKDGTGANFRAKVTERKRLWVDAQTLTEDESSTRKGESYNINTGFITLTNDTETPILYVKNNGEQDYHLKSVVVGVFTSTGGSGDSPYATFIKNPTTGTIIDSTPTNVDINSNRNYGSDNTLTFDAYKGATGDTMTDGDNHILALMKEDARSVVPIDEVIPKGKSFGVKFAPRTGNTSLKVYCALVGNLIDPKDT